MKVKEIDRTANIAWSPGVQHPIYLAAGTAAQQLDATFSTSAALELYSLDLSEPGKEMEMVGSIPSDFRFHKLVWGSFGMDNSSNACGVLAGGADNGNVFVWDPAKIIDKEDALLHRMTKHVGAVTSLDSNPFQSNLLASGASESEIYIWDLNNPDKPMTPGSKSQPPDDVTCLAWNQQVQHILASTYSGRCVVWDLRKNEPIIKVSDSMSRIKSKLVAWHPDVATQLCLASEDDHSPVIQLWDLRFASSPLKSLENHQRGILSIAWCSQDSDLLLSCGKDNRILCWDPNSQVQTGEVVYELPTSHQWSFDVQWCPRNPAIISSCSFDGHVGIYSLMGGAPPPQTPSKVAAAFSNDVFGQLPQQPQTTEPEAEVTILKKPPKWLRRPVGASFAFGGKLITFENSKSANPQQPAQRLVNISQVVTETDLVARSNQLENALVTNQFGEFCSLKIANSKDDTEESIWNFMKVNFEKDPRNRYLQLLGYDQTDLGRRVNEVTGSDVAPVAQPGVDASELAEKMALLNATGSPLAKRLVASGQASPYICGPQTPSESDQQQAAPVDGAAAFEQIASQEQDSRSDSPLPIAVDNDCEGLVTQALLMANFEAAVEVCLHHDRMAEAIILAIAGGPELLSRTQKTFFHKNKGGLSRLISSLVTRDFEHIVRTCDIDNWKEALAVSLTYAKADEFANLCDILGSRLETERHGELAAHACLCYICAGKVDQLVECWSKLNSKNSTSPAVLQDLVEKVMVLRKAVESATGQAPEISGGVLAEKLSHYAELLAAQGSLQTAVNYLGSSREESLTLLRYRLYQALGQTQAGAKPFPVVDIQPEGLQRQVPQQQQQQQQQQGAQSQAAWSQQQHKAGMPGHQTQAGSFQTTTTPSSTYYNQNQYTGYNPSGQTSSTYSGAQQQQQQYNQLQTNFNQPQAVTSSAASTGIGRGPISQKYPAYPQQPTSAYNANTYQSTPYQQDPYAPYSSANQGQVMTSQPQIYDPSAAAGQHHSPVYSSDDDPDTDSLGASSSSLHHLRHILSNPDMATNVATGIMKGISRRRSSAYMDTEAIAGVLGSSSPPRLSVSSHYGTESEMSVASGAPAAYVPPSTSSQPSFQDVKPASAWNDPPAVHGTSKKKGENNYQAPAPITQPIFGQPAQDQGPPGGPTYNTSNQYYNPQDYQQQQQQQQQQIAVSSAAQPVEPPKPVEKGPIPAENQILQEIFDKLAALCMERATNPQMKRKMEDVLRKLEALYDKLRAQALSPNIILGLHQMVQAIQAYDYQTGLGYHTQMISQGNFSEISSFMPGIKVLMQMAMQQQVYIQ